MENDDTNHALEGEENETVTLQMEEGSEHEFQVVEALECAGQEYAILLPLRPDQVPDWAEGDALIMRIEAEDGEDVLVEVESEEELQRVSAAWAELCDEEEDEDTDPVQ